MRLYVIYMIYVYVFIYIIDKMTIPSNVIKHLIELIAPASGKRDCKAPAEHLGAGKQLVSLRAQLQWSSGPTAEPGWKINRFNKETFDTENIQRK